MKTNRLFPLLLLLVLMFSRSGYAQSNSSYYKDYSFDINSDSRLTVNSSFSDVTITSWEKNEVYVEVNVNTEAKNQDRADRLMNKIKVSVNGSASEVRIDAGMGSNVHTDGNNTIDIRISIKAPSSMYLDFNSEFGDVKIPDWQGVVDMDIQFGDLDANGLFNNESKVEIQYGDLKIYSATRLDVESSFSDVYISKVQDLEIDSQYDAVEIGEVYGMHGDFQFCDLEISDLRNSMVIDTQYGGVKVKEVSREFDKIVIDNSFGDIRIDLTTDQSFRVDVEMDFASFRCGCKSELNHQEDGFNSDHYWGQIGNGGGSIEIESGYGGVRIDN